MIGRWLRRPCMDTSGCGPAFGLDGPLAALNTIGILECLEHDGRPTFVIDLDDSTSLDVPSLRPAFCNASLRASKALQNTLFREQSWDGSFNLPGGSTRLDYINWIASSTTLHAVKEDYRSTSFVYLGFAWTHFTVRNRWTLVSGNAFDDSAGALAKRELAATTKPAFTRAKSSRSHSIPKDTLAERPLTQVSRLADWTNFLPLTSHVQFFRDTDWSATSLGPLESWSQELRQMTHFLMSDPRPASMFWGPNKTCMYNESYIPLASNKHPKIMGSTFQEAWPEIYKDFELIFANIERTGQGVNMKDNRLFVHRCGYLEEAFFSFSMMPLHDENGHIMGYYNAVFETTQQVVSERRTKTLLSMAVAPNMQSFWSDTLQSLRLSELDFPFALLYSLDEEPRIGTAPITFLCNLQGTIGVPEGHQSAPQQGNIESSKEGFIPCFREAKTQNRPLILRKEDGSLPPALTTGLQWRGFGEPFVAVTFPLSVGNRVFGFLLVGLNSRRPSEDKSSEDFIQLLSRQLSTSMSSAALMEQAARSKAELSKQLEIRTREVEESDTKFKHMAELAPCGMYTVAPDGMIVWANTQWYEMMGHGRRPSDHYPMSFRDCIALEDVSLVEEKWHDLAVTGVKADFEFRTKKSWVNPAGDDSVEYPAWVMALAFPIKYEDGSIRSIMGCTTDISHFKWAESVQTRSRIDAEEAKMQQERFMDVTSHEMRNPLSAILQCAEAIASDLNDYLAAPNKTALLSDNLVQSNLEAAQIITLCSQHQMRIINDVLTMSKLDSKMLLVTPVAAKPIDVVKGVLKMYEGELRSHDIKTQLRFDLSYDELKIDWAFCDPSRIRQVFINVLTNAIKFTRSEPKREIIVTLGGSADKPPRDGVANLQWFASKTPSSHRKDTTSEADWGDGQILYLYFTVKDTGRGLTDEEKTRLFHRFSQASPKTHVQYGGSGLGLFISRELTELQGGEIGVVSEVGKGSTFAFYIKARRAPSQIDEGPRSGHNHKGRDKGADASTVPPAISEDGLQLDTPKYDILLVEDNVVNQKILGKRLEKAGCTVHVANHGQEALDFLRQTRFWRGNSTGKALDLILMDLEMPVMDGLTCTRRIRELQQEGEIEQHIPVIAVTANARTEQVNEAFAAGMDDIMPKPFPVAELMPKMARFTAKH